MIPASMANALMGSAARARVEFCQGQRHGADTGVTTITDNAVPIGMPDPKRYIVAIFSGGTGTASGITSCTIGGVAATQLEEDGVSGGGFISAWIALVPTGTTANISAAVTGSANYTATGVYAIYDLQSTTPVETDVQSLAASATGTATVNVTDGGVVISQYTAYDTSANNAVAWSGTTGVVEVFDDPSAGLGIVSSGAMANIFNTATNLTAICNPGTTTQSEYILTLSMR